MSSGTTSGKEKKRRCQGQDLSRSFTDRQKGSPCFQASHASLVGHAVEKNISDLWRRSFTFCLHTQKSEVKNPESLKNARYSYQIIRQKTNKIYESATLMQTI
jgi:hypothetical protein